MFFVCFSFKRSVSFLFLCFDYIIESSLFACLVVSLIGCSVVLIIFFPCFSCLVVWLFIRIVVCISRSSTHVFGPCDSGSFVTFILCVHYWFSKWLVFLSSRHIPCFCFFQIESLLLNYFRWFFGHTHTHTHSHIHT